MNSSVKVSGTPSLVEELLVKWAGPGDWVDFKPLMDTWKAEARGGVCIDAC